MRIIVGIGRIVGYGIVLAMMCALAVGMVFAIAQG